MPEALRVLHCPENVGAQPQTLAEAERRAGLASRCVSFHESAFGYPADEVLWPPGTDPLTREARRYRLLSRALRDFDVVHFNFGLSILPQWVPPGAGLPDEAVSHARRLFRSYARLVELRDLPLLRRAGKVVVVTFQGDDARQGDELRRRFEIHPADEVPPGYYTASSDAHKRRRIERWDRYAHRIYALNPDLLHVLPERAEFLPYASVDLAAWQPLPHPRNDPPLVVHAPSHRGVKGTRFVLDAVEQLRSEGVPLELRLVEGLTREEARAVYERADLLVDQLLVGWYGGLAVELMALARPVVCYLRDEDLAFLPREMRAELPVVNATPASLADVLRRLLTTDRETLPELGARGRAYAERWHDPTAIGERLAFAYAEAA